MSPLAGTSLRAASRRLRRDKTFTVFAIASMAVTAVLCALAGAWLWGLVKLNLPYQHADELWFVQLQVSGSGAEAYGPEMQASDRAAVEFARAQLVFDAMAAGLPVEGRLGQGDGLGQTISVLDVGGNFFSVLGVRAAVGRLPRVDAGEVVVTDAWAREQVGGEAQALGRSLRLDGMAYRIVGVLGKGFVAPMLLANQRRAGAFGAPEVYRPVDLTTAVAEGSRTRQMILVGRSALPRITLATEGNRFLGKLNEAAGRSPMRLAVQPLPQHMRGTDLLSAGALLAAAVLLALTTLGGLLMLATARFRARAGDQFVLAAIGASARGTTVFERAEIRLIMVPAVVLSMALLASALAVLAHGRVTVGVIDGAFLLRAALLFAVFFAIAGGLLVLVLRVGRRAVQAQGAALRATRGAARSGVQRWFFRVLILVQTLVALVTITAMLVLVHSGLDAFRTAYANEYDGLTEWQFEFTSATVASGGMAQDLASLKEGVKASSGVENAAIMLADSSLDLSGPLVAYHGPKASSATVLSDSDGSSIIRVESDGAPRGGPDMVNYRVSVVAVEPAFFNMLGYRLETGRVFADAESDAAMVTPEAALVMFGRGKAAVGNVIPTGPQSSSGGSLLSGRTVVGVVDAGRVGQANLLGDFMAGFPVVFIPYDAAREHSSDAVRKATIVIRHDDGVALGNAALARMVAHRHLVGVRGRSVVVQREVQRRLMRHMLGSFGILLLGSVVLLAALLAAMGGMRWNCQQRASEIGVRIALGAQPRQVGMQLGRQELAMPVMLVVLWFVVCAFVGVALSITGAGSALGAGGGLAASLLVLVTVSGGFLLGVLGPLRQPPMDALRAE